MNLFVSIFQEAWHLFLESSIYMIFGLVFSGMLRVFLNPNIVAMHLGTGRFLSVIKAAMLGVPVPL